MFVTTLALVLMQQAPAEGVDWDSEFGVKQTVRDPQTGEFPVDPYDQDNANAGAQPFDDAKLAASFGGQDGIRRITQRLIEESQNDPRIAQIFVSHDMVRLNRTLFEQLCYLLAAGCDYTGRDMKSAHDGMGLTKGDLNALVENLQAAMREEGVPFAAQNRLLSKLAPMSRDVVER